MWHGLSGKCKRGVTTQHKAAIVKLQSKAFWMFVVLAIIYASISLIAAPPRAFLLHYTVSESQLRILNSTVVAPVIIIWFISLYGYQKLRTYASHVRDEHEGRQVLLLTRGVMLLAFSQPITSSISTVLSVFVKHHPNLIAASTIILDYVSLLFALFAFGCISIGSRRMSVAAKLRPKQSSVHIMALLLILAGVTYGYLVANNRSDLHTIYHLPLGFVLFTIVVPYIFSWYLGLLAANELRLYTSKIHGAIYKMAWNTLAFGLIWLITFSVVYQYLTSVSVKLGDLPLWLVLVCIYGILAIRAVGYVFVALGAKRLTKIEEV